MPPTPATSPDSLTDSSTGSYWLVSTRVDPQHPPLTTDTRADVCVIGAGIVGVTTAWLLQQEGHDVLLIDADRIGAGVSGATTAKVTSLHGMAYAELTGSFGAQRAGLYAQAQQDALGWMASTTQELGIDCDWRERPAITYTTEPARVQQVDEELAAAAAAGLPVRAQTDLDLPFPVAGAIVLDGQAEFHPRKYLLALAERFVAAGGRIAENTRATNVKEDDEAPVVQTPEARITARHVVVATHAPFLDRGLFFARVTAQRSYAIGVRVDPGTPIPRGMFYGHDTAARSLRAHPLGGAEELLIVGGEGHKTGQDDDTAARLATLESWAREHFAVRDVPYRWSSQDLQSADGLPYVGAYRPGSKTLWVATALRKWGFTNGTAAAHVLTERIAGRTSPVAELLDANRLEPKASVGTLVKENLNVARRMVGDHLYTTIGGSDIEALAAGEGAVARVGLKKIAAYRDPAGDLHLCSAICTHLGCEVRFNTAERTWDCPCHGSRFAVDGQVLEGPAVHPLSHEHRPAGAPVQTP